MEWRITQRGKKSVGIISYKDATGQYAQKWITAEPYETNKQLERRILDWIEDYEESDINNPNKVTFGAFIQQWINTKKKISDTTRDGYNIYIKKHIIPNIGHIKLSKLKPMDLDKFYQKLYESTYKKGEEEIFYSQNTILQIHAIIHKALRYAVSNKLRRDNPADYCENKPVHERYEGTVYTDIQFQDLMGKVKGTIDEVCIILAGCLGLRRGEVLGLKWENIDIKEMIIYIRQTKVRSKEHGIIEKAPKNKKSIRDISVNKKTIDALKRWHKANTDSIFVINEFNPNTYSGHFKLLLERHNLPPTRFHDLRHFAATFMLKEGISDKVASERLGHSNVSTTRDIYQHVLKEMDREAANKLDKLMK